MTTKASRAIKTLGGTFAVAELFAIDPRVVTNWHRRGLPPDTSEVLGPLLKRHNFEFTPAQLFGQRELASEDQRIQWRKWLRDEARQKRKRR